MRKEFSIYLLVGAAVGTIVGLLKGELIIWLIISSGIGLLTGSIVINLLNREAEPDQLIWVGFFMLFPILFFTDRIKGTFWYDFFGVIAVVGAMTCLINFVGMLKKLKKKR